MLSQSHLIGLFAFIALCGGCATTETRPQAASPTADTAPSQLGYPLEALTQTQKVELDVLAYNARGGTTVPVELTVGPNPRGEPEIKIAETSSAGAGGGIRASVWSAALVAASAAGRALEDYTIEVRFPGQIDGDSAGAPLAGAMLAAMSGVPVRSDIGVSGSIMPNGAVGPVGGLPAKFRAGAAIGKTVLGYPVGQRQARSRRTKKTTDLEVLAAQLGASAVEVESVYDVFKLLTGRDFPRPYPVSRAEMRLTGRNADAVRQFVRTLRAASRKLEERAADIGVPIGSRTNRRLLRRAKRHLRRSDGYATRGRAAAALYHLSTGFADLLLAIARHRFALRAGTADGIRRELGALDKGGQRIIDWLDRAGQRSPPSSLRHVVALVSAYERILAGFVQGVGGRLRWGRSNKALERLLALDPKDPQRRKFNGTLGWAIRFALVPRVAESRCEFQTPTGDSMAPFYARLASDLNKGSVAQTSALQVLAQQETGPKGPPAFVASRGDAPICRRSSEGGRRAATARPSEFRWRTLDRVTYYGRVPRIFEWRSYVFFFYSNEGVPREPLHVHVRKNTAVAKYWLEPEVELVGAYGMTARELRQLKGIVEKNVERIRGTWNDFFNG